MTIVHIREQNRADARVLERLGADIDVRDNGRAIFRHHAPGQRYLVYRPALGRMFDQNAVLYNQ